MSVVSQEDDRLACIEVQPVEGELVPRVRALDALGPQERRQSADEDGELFGGPGGKGIAPEALGQVVDADRAAVVERQDLEQRALLATAQRGQVAAHPEGPHAPILAPWGVRSPFSRRWPAGCRRPV